MSHRDMNQKAVEYDKTHGVHVPSQRSGRTFLGWFTTNYEGFILFRLYKKKISIDDLQQDFSYSFKT